MTERKREESREVGTLLLGLLEVHEDSSKMEDERDQENERERERDVMQQKHCLSTLVLTNKIPPDKNVSRTRDPKPQNLAKRRKTNSVHVHHHHHHE